MRKLLTAFSIIAVTSVLITIYAPISELFRGVTVLPAVAALSAALFQLLRDYSLVAKERNIWLRDNRLRAYAALLRLIRTYGHDTKDEASYMEMLAAASEVELLSTDSELPDQINKLVNALNNICKLAQSQETDSIKIKKRLSTFNELAKPICLSLKRDIHNH